MKKQYFMLCILLLCFLTACGKPTSNTGASELESNIQESEYVTQNTEIANPILLENRIQADEKGVLWQIPNAYVEQGLQQTLLPFGEHLLIYGANVDENQTMVFNIAILSMEDGSVLHNTTLKNLEIPNLQICGTKIVVTDWLSGNIFFLDSKLQTIKTYHANAQNGAIYVSPDTSKVYCFSQKGGIEVIDINTEKTEILLQNTSNLLASSIGGEFVSLGYIDLDTQMEVSAILNLKTGKVESVPFEGIFYDVEYHNSVWKAGIVGMGNEYLFGKEHQANIFVPNDENGIANMLHNPSRLCISAYKDDGFSRMKLYDMSGNFISEAVLPQGTYSPFYDIVWSDTYGGYFFTVTNFDGKDILLFWDLSVDINGENLQFIPQQENTQESGSAVSQTLYEKAKEISLAYGIDIKIAEQTGTDFGDFMAVRELNESYISKALQTLENVCASYPKGFIEQLLHGTQKEIEIHLVGTLTKLPIEETNTGFTSFDAFVQQQSGKTVLVIDVTRTDVFEQTLYHEIAHLIDHKLVFDATLREDALYSEEAWQTFNPEGFVYAESYHDIPMELYDIKYDEYFVDLYSRTFEKEDKARIMEYAMMEREWAFSSENLYAKLEYWSRCIRDAFDTTGWPEETKWEKML